MNLNPITFIYEKINLRISSIDIKLLKTHLNGKFYVLSQLCKSTEIQGCFLYTLVLGAKSLLAIISFN